MDEKVIREVGDELAAMRTVTEALQPLPEDSRVRVLAYCVSRYVGGDRATPLWEDARKRRGPGRPSTVGGEG